MFIVCPKSNLDTMEEYFADDVYSIIHQMMCVQPVVPGWGALGQRSRHVARLGPTDEGVLLIPTLGRREGSGVTGKEP